MEREMLTVSDYWSSVMQKIQYLFCCLLRNFFIAFHLLSTGVSSVYSEGSPEGNSKETLDSRKDKMRALP